MGDGEDREIETQGEEGGQGFHERKIKVWQTPEWLEHWRRNQAGKGAAAPLKNTETTRM